MPVVNDHEHDHDQSADERRTDALIDGILAERRAHGHVLDDLHRRGKRLAQHDGELRRLVVREVAGDLGVSAADPVLDPRRRMDHAVEDDGKLLAHVLAR